MTITIALNVPKTVTINTLQTVQINISRGVRTALQEMLFPFHKEQRNKVGAIKVLRDELGIGLKEAKDIADSITSLEQLHQPEGKEQETLNKLIAERRLHEVLDPLLAVQQATEREYKNSCGRN